MNFPPLIAWVFDESDADAHRVSCEIEAIRTRFEGEPVGDTVARKDPHSHFTFDIPAGAGMGRHVHRALAGKLRHPRRQQRGSSSCAQPARDEPGSLPDSRVGCWIGL
jgi:hypothetical protein